MAQDTNHRGLATIHAALTEALTHRGLAADVDCTVEETEPRGATFKVTLEGKTEAQHFGWDEVDDSGEAINAPAALKVRMLVSHFVR